MSTSFDSQDAEWQSDKHLLLNPSQIRSTSPSKVWLIIALAVVIITNAVSITFAMQYMELRGQMLYSQDFEEAKYIYPGLDRSLGRVQFSEHRVNGTSRWTAPPSPLVDGAWIELGVRDKGFLIPKALGQTFGLDPKEHLYDPKGSYKGEEDLEGFFVFVQGFHDLHCLNELRRALYFNKPYYRQYENDTEVSEPFRVSHINHCLDNIRERLMCTADAGIIPSLWTGPDTENIRFSNEHKCHNYDALLAWKATWEEKHPAFLMGKTTPLQAPEDAIFHDPGEWIA